MKQHTRWEVMMYQKYLMHQLGNSAGVVDYERFDQFELLVLFEDGHKELFNSADNGIRMINPNRQNILEMGKDRYAMEFAFKLRTKMQNASMSPEELSASTGISKQSISKYLNCSTIPNFYNVIKIANALKCDVNEFLRIPK